MVMITMVYIGDWNGVLIECQTRDRKVTNSNPERSGGRIFFSRVMTLIRCPFHPRVTAVAHERSWSSAKSASGRLHLNTHTLLTQRSRTGLTMSLSRYSVGTYSETSSHATCQGTFGHISLSSLSNCGLILA